VNLARELMGHRPVEVEPAPSQGLSRPAELVQRAKQLAQLTNFQFGRGTVTLNQPQTNNDTTIEIDTDAISAGGSSFLNGNGNSNIPSNGNGHVSRLEIPPLLTNASSNGNGNGHSSAGGMILTSTLSPAAAPVKTTAQKIEEFYGVKQVGEEVVFAAKFESAKKVLLAGDFNNWSPQSTPLAAERPGVWKMSLPLPPGRYRYRFVVDGKWITDPNNQYVEANQFGELNNVIEVD
jgi:hypothetical protein